MPTRPPSHRPFPRQPKPPRPSAASRGYGRKWQAASKAFLVVHPCCVECGELIEGDGVVDHDPPHKGDMRAFWDSATWRAMHKRCHDRKTANQDGGFGR